MLAGYWRVEILRSTSLLVSFDIHTLFLASFALGLGIARKRSANGPSYLIGVVGSQRGSRMLRPRYFECSLKVALQRHPRIK